MRLFAWVVRIFVAVLLLSASVRAEYKPVDISDITGEERRTLGKLWTDLRKMPPEARDGFICEQLGLMFSGDYSQVMGTVDGHPATMNTKKAYFVGRKGKPLHWWEAADAAHERWGQCYDATKQFKLEAPLVPFKKEVRKVTCNTAKYLLKTMPKEQRWWILAFMGNMVYNDQGPYDRGRGEWEMENGIRGKSPHSISGYAFLDPEGKEHDVRKVYLAYDNAWRWVLVVWRCENLVGSKDILALFPEEVEAMRKHYKERIAQLKDEAKAKNDALLVAADEAMSSLPKEKRLARVALAMGLYYLDHKEAGCADGHLNPNATIILPDGTKHSGEEFVDEAPGLLQQVPHEAILEYYRQPIEQMARAVAEERFKQMPAPLRDLLRAQLSDKLIKFDGSPAKMKEDHWRPDTFDRKWDLQPKWTEEPEKTWFIDSKGEKCSFNTFTAYVEDYGQTISIAYICAHILGKEETVKLIPPGDVETGSNDAASGGTGSTAAEEDSIPLGQTALDSTTREGADTPQDKLLAQGQTALREMTAGQRRAWLAEGMGFCFTEDGAPAYQSERTANENAVYVDAQGKVRKWTEVPGKGSPGWIVATNAARLVGYDLLTTPCKGEIRQLAVQTSKYILTSMPPEQRQSWLAERNRFLFMSNANASYIGHNWILESGVKISFQGEGSKLAKCLYYDPSGKIVQTAKFVWEVWEKRWRLLFYCETVAGIDAINALFSSEVELMRTAYKKSPFYKK